MTLPTVTPAFCGECVKTTNQKVLCAHRHIDTEWLDDETAQNTSHDYMILQCSGCNTISFMHREHINDSDGDCYESQYPDPLEDIDESIFLPEEEVDLLPRMISNLYAEMEDAYCAESNVLAGIGLRTLVEAICIQQNIPGRNLQDKIQKLHTRGLISASEHPILDKLRLIGNVSAHQIKSISMSKLEAAVHVINHVLKSVYILPKLGKRIRL